MKEIDKLLQEGVDQQHFPGANYAIVNKDGTIDFGSIGYMQTTPFKVNNSIHTIYDCASLTKVISTTTLILQLIEKGVISLDSMLRTFLPRLKHPITVYDCLTHSSGLPADIPNAKTLKSKKQVEDYVYNVSLQYETSTKIIYSDIGYILLGFLIEELEKKPISSCANERIFKPLQMRDTSYQPDPNKTAPTEYRDDTVYQGLLQGKVHDEKSFALQGESGHAGMFSTVLDVSKFIQSILRNDGQVLKPETVDLLFKEQISYQSTYLIQRALGWDKPTVGGTSGAFTSYPDTILHTGFTGCNIWIDRKVGLGFVLLSNGVHPERNMNKIHKYRGIIADIILSKEEEDV